MTGKETMVIPDGYILVGYRVQSLWQGMGWSVGIVCVRRGTRPVIDSPGNQYAGPRTWDIERRGDMGRIEFGLRTTNIERMVDWYRRRSNDTPREWVEVEIREAIERRL